MAATIFNVIQPGIFTTIQDLGRRGYFASGIPPSGAMDRFSLRFGNLLVKNPLGEAGIEITAVGPKLEVVTDTVIALTGAPFEAKVNGKVIPSWQTVSIKAGDVLTLGRPATGFRGYICVAGGIDVPLMLGSKSTYAMGKFGGFRGRPLKKGDILLAGPPRASLEELKGRRAKDGIPPSMAGGIAELRVVLGPQDDHVRDDSVREFLTEPYRASIHSDRVGYRFEGPRLFFKEREQSRDAGSDPSNIVDDGNAIGAIQIPAGKEPICMGPDGVSMGGYVKIACLIAADMDRLAQVGTGQTVRFKSVSVEEARSILMESIARVCDDNIDRI